MLKANLIKGVVPSDQKIYLPREFIKGLDRVGERRYALLAVTWKDGREIMRFNFTEPFKSRADKDAIDVIRAMANTPRRTFPVGTCVSIVSMHDVV